MSKISHSFHSKHRNTQIHLRTIELDDLEYLRRWKNEYRFSFFYQHEISPAQQQVWFDQYLTRPDDYMFLITCNDATAGCIGIRKQKDYWDLYNLIMADARWQGKGIMRACVQQLVTFANHYACLPIKVEVLHTNPAKQWYLHIGFQLLAVHEKHDTLIYAPKHSNS